MPSGLLEIQRSDLVDNLDVFIPRLTTVEVFPDVNRTEIVHVLIDELGDRNLRQIAVRLIADQTSS